MVRILFTLLAGMFAAGLSAQATLPVNGTVTGDEALFLLDIDFGGSASTAVVTLSISGDSATEGLDVFLADLDAFAATGPATTTDSSSDAGTGTINLSVTSASYTGVHQFIVSVKSFTGVGNVNFTGTVAAATLATGAITLADTESFDTDDLPLVKRLFDRAFIAVGGVDSSGTPIFEEFLLDFGGTAHTATFSLIGEGDVAGTLDVVEVLANGTLSTIGALTGAAAGWDDFTTVTTSSRSGIVRIRIVADTPNLDFKWSVILPTNATGVAYSQLTLSGSLAAGEFRFRRFTVDYGAVATAVMLQFVEFTGAPNIDISFVDMDELAANGSATGVPDLDAVMNLRQYSGVRDFLLVLRETSGTPAAYSAIFQVSANVAAAGNVAVNELHALTALLGRGVSVSQTTPAAETITREFNVDFGPTAHTADVWIQGSITTGNSIELLEVNGAATTSIVLLTGAGTVDDEDNGTTTSRSGVVRFRVVITTTGASDYSFIAVFSDDVTVALLGGGGGGGGGGGDDGGCSTGQTSSNWLALLGLLATITLATRVRRQKA